MTDVFISYARADEERAGHIAAQLRTLGFDVWWDRRLGSGVEWEMEIERRLQAAKAVVVIWSAESVISAPVRAEAREALAVGKLIPILIGDARPPLFFREHQYEDFTDWSGGTEEAPFQRLAIQVAALVEGQEAAAALPMDGATRPMPLAEPIRTGPFKSAGSYLTLLGVAAGVALLLGGWRVEDVLGEYWETILGLAAAAIALFQLAENDLTAPAKAMVARWLRSDPDAKPIRAGTAFLAMFEAVFTRRHWTLRCFWRSAVASVLIYAALLLALIDFEVLSAAANKLLTEGFVTVDSSDVDIWGVSALETNVALLFIAIPLTNIFVDYISLWETRTLLRFSHRGLPMIVAVALDAVFTALIFILILPMGPILALAAQGGFSAAAVENALAFAPEIWDNFFAIFNDRPLGELESVLAGEGNISNTTLLIAFATSFTTSIWLWLALVFAPLFRLLSWSRRSGLSWIGAVFNVRGRPIAALGYVTAALILVGGGAGGAVASALQRAAEQVDLAALEPGDTFQECRQCPRMVVIPAGDFIMGSLEDEPGREKGEGPRRSVSLPAFALGVYEATIREWDACAAEGYCVDNPVTKDSGWGRGLRPVSSVAYNDIVGEKGFLDWLNSKVDGAPYRLPTEAEWEYAARAGTQTPYWFGDAITSRNVNFRDGEGDRYRRRTLPVGGLANPFGLYDVHGNIEELTIDCWHEGYDDAPTDGSAWMAENNGDCGRAVARGGAWYWGADYNRSAWRRWTNRDQRGGTITGFRVARTLPSASAE